VRAQGAAVPELDNPVAIPVELAYLFAWFTELSAARGSGGFGANPISYAEIDAWARLTGTAPTPFEISVIRLLDGALLRNLSDG